VVVEYQDCTVAGCDIVSLIDNYCEDSNSSFSPNLIPVLVEE